MYKQSNQVARNMLKFTLVIGWVAVVLGAIVLLMGLSQGGMGFAVTLPSAIVSAIGGLMMVATAQIGVAILDQTDLSRAMLAKMHDISVDELERQLQPKAAARTESSAGSVNSGKSTTTRVEGDTETRTYKGEEVTKVGRGDWMWNGTGFSTWGKAKEAIDQRQ